jgi:hypothetical protein
MSCLKSGLERTGASLGKQVLYMMQQSIIRLIQLFGAETSQEETRKGRIQAGFESQSEAEKVSSSEQASAAKKLATAISKQIPIWNVTGRLAT